MNVVWLILDSLSFSATPFSNEGPSTMPRLESLANEQGVVFTEAYAPGPISPSSHASFFTGLLPSETGMFAANPYFDGRQPTIADVLNDSHRSYLISSNPFLFRGLQEGFPSSDYLENRDYIVFEDGSDPVRFSFRDLQSKSKLERITSFCFRDGNPVRSFVNGVSYTLFRVRGQSTFIPRNAPRDDSDYQYANTMGTRIEEFLDADPSDAFVVANYMDIHPPLDASDEAIQQFAPDRSRADLPIGVKGQAIHNKIQSVEEYEGEDMYNLYKAVVWDTDRKVAPLVERLLDEDAMVVVTADHGNWFRRDTDLDEERLHVPLLIFAPGESAYTVDHTVNLRHLARTTETVVGNDDPALPGESLLDVTTDQISITEHISNPQTHGVVNLDEMSEESVHHDIAAISGDTRVNLVDGEFEVTRGDEEVVKKLKEEIKSVREAGVSFSGIEDDLVDSTSEQLKNLGYL